MKSRAHFEQAGRPAAQSNSSCRRLGNSAQNFEQRAFAGSVVTDDADNLTFFDLKVDIFQGPELFDFITLYNLAPAKHIDSLACEIARLANKNITQRGIALAAPCPMSNEIALGKI